MIKTRVPIVRHLSKMAGDIGLVVLAVAVMGGAGYALVNGSQPGVPRLAAAYVQPSASADPVQPPSAPIVLVGPDLVALQGEVATRSGGPAIALVGNSGTLAASLATVSGRPRVVILEIIAGSATRTRTALAITTIRGQWPDIRIVVLGPFSSTDQRSTAAVQTAALAAGAEFVDPVALRWRSDDLSQLLSDATRGPFADKLVAAVS